MKEMNNCKRAITLAICCCIILTTAPSASADFVGVTTVIKDDPDTEFLCTQGNGDFVPGPLTVCNVFAVFDDPADRLLSVGNGDLQVYSGAKPEVFFHHPLDVGATAPSCSLIDFVAPDLICDTFVTIGYKCAPDPAGTDSTRPDGDFHLAEFFLNGHILGGWYAIPTADDADQGAAGQDPPNQNLQVLFLQSSVAKGLSLSGDIDIFWRHGDTEVVAEVDVPIECAAVGQDPCECVNGRVTLCHIPPGNLANARTITVGCAARDKHLAHGDTCGPCEDGDG